MPSQLSSSFPLEASESASESASKSESQSEQAWTSQGQRAKPQAAISTFQLLFTDCCYQSQHQNQRHYPNQYHFLESASASRGPRAISQVVISNLMSFISHGKSKSFTWRNGLCKGNSSGHPGKIGIKISIRISISISREKLASESKLAPAEKNQHLNQH